MSNPVQGLIRGALRLGKLFLGGKTSAATVIGGGTSTDPISMPTAGTNAVGFWTSSTATSGDSRGMYVRHFFSGAGGSGEAVRAYGTVNNVTAATGGTVNGAHVSLSVTGASGAVSGSGHASRHTLDLGASTVSGGTLSVVEVDTNIDTTATIPATAAFLGVNNVGVGKLGYFARMSNMDTSACFRAGRTAATINAATTAALKVNVNGTDYWIPLATGI